MDTRDKYWDWYMPDIKAAMDKKGFALAIIRATSGRVTKQNLDWIDHEIDTRFPAMRTESVQLMLYLKDLRREVNADRQGSASPKDEGSAS